MPSWKKPLQNSASALKFRKSGMVGRGKLFSEVFFCLQGISCCFLPVSFGFLFICRQKEELALTLALCLSVQLHLNKDPHECEEIQGTSFPLLLFVSHILTSIHSPTTPWHGEATRAKFPHNSPFYPCCLPPVVYFIFSLWTLGLEKDRMPWYSY